MNPAYLLLGFAIVAAVIALVSLTVIIAVTLGKAKWNSRGAFWAHVFYVAGAATTAIWLGHLAFLGITV